MSLCPHPHYDNRLRHAFNDLLRDFDYATTPYFDPSRALQLGTTMGEVVNNKEKFAVGLDVSQFKPEELKVNVIGNSLVIEGHHEEKDDEHGSIQRSFIRKYHLPQDANVDGLHSNLSKEGKLTIEAPKRAAEGPQPKAIPIQHS